MKSIAQNDPVVISQESQIEPAVDWERTNSVIYTRLLEQCPDDLLVCVRQRFDIGELAAACADYRQFAGQRGQEERYAVITLCWALLLKYLRGWSYRRTCMEIRANFLCRWFVGYGIEEPTLCYVTLQRFAAWVTINHAHLLFIAILTQIDEDFPANPVQAGDTFALLANVAPQSRTAMLRDAGRRLLNQVQQATPMAYAQIQAEFDLDALFGAHDAAPEYRLSKAERDRLELATALAAAQLLHRAALALPPLSGPLTVERAALERWRTILAKLVDDEFMVTADAQGVPCSARICTKSERGSFVLGSTMDPDATFRKHGKRCDLGYNVQVAADGRFVRAIFATTGAASDSSGVATLVEQQATELGTMPTRLVYDRAAGLPKIFADVARASGGQTQLVARLIDHSKGQPGFSPLDFTLNEDGSLTCPNGQTTSTCYRNQAADGWNYRFAAKLCLGCPLRELCRNEAPQDSTQDSTQDSEGASTQVDPPTEMQAETQVETGAKTKKKRRKGPKPTSYRQVFISHYRAQQRTAILYTKSPAFVEDMKFRASIERIIAALVRYNDARHAHGRGLANADFQMQMAATAYNLKKWHKLTLDAERATHYRPGEPPPDPPSEPA